MTITPPRLANDAERKVYEALIAQLQAGDRVIPGQRVTDHLKDHEIDFVVAIEGAGIVCVEVKGGDISYGPDGWLQGSRTRRLRGPGVHPSGRRSRSREPARHHAVRLAFFAFSALACHCSSSMHSGVAGMP